MKGKEAADNGHEQHAPAHAAQHRDDPEEEGDDEERQRPDPPRDGGGIATLRIFKSLYPEGDAVCHNVLVHPPSGLVGGDTLDMRVTVGHGAHGLDLLGRVALGLSGC
jgi:hypothetical protein